MRCVTNVSPARAVRWVGGPLPRSTSAPSNMFLTFEFFDMPPENNKIAHIG